METQMAYATRLLVPGLAAVLLAGCSIDVNDHGGRYVRYDHESEPHYGMRRVQIIEPFESREQAGEAMAAAMDRLRGAGCDIVSADRWHEIDKRDGPDIRGMRVSADCPQSARLF